mmetsp:Transcript_45098/g.104484  ORF Transcript_45098/g.104484 Transcript_45098/m.104484 type:complete len:1736 (+) Transcript_45098:116-5323(+)
MDVVVLNAENLPAKTYLSLRVGETRKQAPFQVDERFHFPSAASKCLTIDVFEKLGSTQVSLVGLGEDAKVTRQERLEFPRRDGSKMKVDLQVECNEGLSDEAVKRSARISRHQAALRAKNYLDANSVQGLLQEMVQQLLSKQPEEPLDFMCNFLQEQRARKPVFDKASAKVPPEELSKAPHPGFSTSPGLGELDYPGFSPFSCPEVLPAFSSPCTLLGRVLGGEPALYEKFRERRTAGGVSLARCIKPGVDDKGEAPLGIGLVAGDAQCYVLFEELFDKVILEAQGLSCMPDSQSVSLRYQQVPAMPPDLQRLVQRVRITTRRGIAGVSFPPACSRDERKEVERVASHSLEEFTGNLAGEYTSCSATGFSSRPAEASRILAPPSSVSKLASGLGRHWPEARGVFQTKDGTTSVWVNDEDHICMEVTANQAAGIYEVLENVQQLHSALECRLRQDGYDFAKSQRLGYLCTSPAYVGTGQHVQVTMKLQLLAATASFAETCAQLRLQAARSRVGDGVFEISNRACLGSTAQEQVQHVWEGCRKLAEMEVRLQTAGNPTPSPALPLASRDAASDSGPLAASAAVPQQEQALKNARLGLGDEEFPGFSVELCPEEIPDLSKHHSLMATAMKKDPNLYKTLKGLRTPNGVTFAKVIKPGIDNRGHAMIRSAGLVAGDDACYDTFRALFDAVLLERPGGRICEVHKSDFDARKVQAEDLDPSGKHVLEVQVRICRNIGGIRFPSACNMEERREAERVLTKALLRLPHEFAGRYNPLRQSSSYAPMPEGMAEAEEAKLNEDGMLFAAPDSQFVLSAGMGRHWPDARGVFTSSSSGAHAWINEEEHLKLTAHMPGSNLQKVFASLCSIEESVRESLQKEGYKFAHSQARGFLTTCPTNAGTGLRASAILHLPALVSKARFRDLCKQLRLQVRNVGSVAGTTYEVSNTGRLGMSEVEQVNSLIAGIRELLQMDEAVAEEEEDPGTLEQEESEGFSRDCCPSELPDLTFNYTVMGDILKENPALYDRCRAMSTSKGVPFAQVIKPGMDLQGHPMVRSLGVVAGDTESFTMFRELLYGVMRKGLHTEPEAPHPTDLDPSKVADMGLKGNAKVHGLRLEASRNLEEYRFPSSCSKDEREAIERVVTKAFNNLSGSFGGSYSSLATTSESMPGASASALSPFSQANGLRKSGLMLEEPDSAALVAMGFGRDWPDSRGMYVMKDSRSVIWVNGEDHLQLILTRKDGDVASIFRSLCSIHNEMETGLQQQGHCFAHSPELGFLGANLANLGVAMRLCIVVSLRRVAAEPYFRETCRQLGLLVRPVPGPFGSVQADRHEVSNAERLGYSEVEVIGRVVAGTRILIEMEEALETGTKVLRPGLHSEPFTLGQAVAVNSLDFVGQQSTIAKVLRSNQRLCDELKSYCSELGVSLAEVVRPALEARRRAIVQGSEETIGFAAGDGSCYKVFSRALDPALEAWHRLPVPLSHPWSQSKAQLQPLPVECVAGIRVALSRSLIGYRLSPACSSKERQEVERLVVAALESHGCNMEGEYYPLAVSSSFSRKPVGMSTADEQRFKRAGLYFTVPEAVRLLSAGVGREWPDARGIFANSDNKLAAWINAEEHLTLIAVHSGDSLEAAFDSVSAVEQAVNSHLQEVGSGFAWSERHGYLTAFPERLGSGLTATVTLKLPKLAQSSATALPEVSGAGNPVVRKGRQGIIEVTNSTTFGVSSVAILESVNAAAAKLVAAEQAL